MLKIFPPTKTEKNKIKGPSDGRYESDGEYKLPKQPSFPNKELKVTKIFTCPKLGKKLVNLDEHGSRQEDTPKKAEKSKDAEDFSRFHTFESPAVRAQKYMVAQTPKT